MLRTLGTLSDVADGASVALAFLAGATLLVYIWLGITNQRIARAAGKQAEAVHEHTEVALQQVAEAQRQTEVAHKTLDAQIKPALIPMTMDIGQSENIVYPGRVEPVGGVVGAVHAAVDEGNEVMCSVPFRSAGRGLAMIRGVGLDLGTELPTPNVMIPQTNLPPGEAGRVNFRAVPGDASFAAFADCIRNGRPISVEVGYSDMAGGQYTVSRFDVHFRSLAHTNWEVRQVHFLEPGEEPYAGSGPVA